jgi:hypothetical protein
MLMFANANVCYLRHCVGSGSTLPTRIATDHSPPQSWNVAIMLMVENILAKKGHCQLVVATLEDDVGSG